MVADKLEDAQKKSSDLLVNSKKKISQLSDKAGNNKSNIAEKIGAYRGGEDPQQRGSKKPVSED